MFGSARIRRQQSVFVVLLLFLVTLTSAADVLAARQNRQRRVRPAAATVACAGAALQFPVVGRVGWVRWDPDEHIDRGDGTFLEYHSGVDFWPKDGAGADVFPPADGYIIGAATNKLTLFLPGVNGGTSVYLGYVIHSFTKTDADKRTQVFADKPIGKVKKEYQRDGVTDNSHVHLSVALQPGEQRGFDLYMEKTQDPSPYFGARLNGKPLPEGPGDKSHPTTRFDDWEVVCDATRITFPVELKPGSSRTIDRTVKTPVVPSKPDIVFLADTTGSMGGAIADVQAEASKILAAIRDVQPNAAFGVAEYKDFDCDANPYLLDQPLTKDFDAVQAAIDGWYADGGCDTDEAQLNALHQLATSGAVGWRSGSAPIVVWFGDAPGHDPSDGVTLEAAVSALKAAHVKVFAVDLYDLDGYGQAKAITDATGGKLESLASATVAVARIRAQDELGPNARRVAPWEVVGPASLSDTILTGLTSLPVTVRPDVPRCGPYLTVTPDAAGKTVTSGEDVTFTFTVKVANTLPLGANVTCDIRFTSDGQPVVDTGIVRPLVITLVPDVAVDRVATGGAGLAAAISRSAFPRGTRTVVVTSAQDDWRVGIAAAAAAAWLDAPLLFVARKGVPTATSREIQRLAPKRIIVVGRTGAVTARVVARLGVLTGASVRRVTGATTADTASALARVVYRRAGRIVYVSSTTVGPSVAVPAAATAGFRGSPILLVAPDQLPSSTARELRRLRPSRIVVIGDEGSVSDAVLRRLGRLARRVDRLAGAPEAIAAALSASTFEIGSRAVYILPAVASGATISVAAAAGFVGGPVLLVGPGAVPASAKRELARLRPGRIVVVASPAAVGSPVLSTLRTYLAD